MLIAKRSCVLDGACGNRRRDARNGTALEVATLMKLFVFCALMSSVGCATAQPLVISPQQRTRFQNLVRDAEAAGAAEGPPAASARLADAKSEFEYAQHLPMYPDRARLLIAQAEADAEAALEIARRDARSRATLRYTGRQQTLAGVTTP